MADQMPNGKMTLALDAAALNETFSKIVFNVLGDQNWFKMIMNEKNNLSK